MTKPGLIRKEEWIDRDPHLGGRKIKYRLREGRLDFWSGDQWLCAWRKMIVLEDEDVREILARRDNPPLRERHSQLWCARCFSTSGLCQSGDRMRCIDENECDRRRARRDSMEWPGGEVGS